MKFKYNNLYSFIYSFFKVHKWKIIATYFVSFIIALLSIVNPYLLKILVDKIEYSKSVSSLLINEAITKIVILLIVINFFISALWKIINYLDLKIFPFVKAKIYSKTFDYVSKHSQRYFQNNLAGDLSNKIQNISESVEEIFSSLFYIIYAFFFVIITVYMSSMVNFYFSIVIFTWIVFFIFISFKLSKKIKNYSANHAHANSILSGKCVNSFMNIFNISIFMRHRYEKKYLDYFCQQVAEKDVSLRWQILKVLFVQGALCALILGVVIIILNFLFSKDLVTSGDFVFIVSNTTNIAYLVFGLSEHITKVIDKIGVFNQAISVLYLPHTLSDISGARALKVSQGKIDFKNVDFEYQESKKVFNMLSINISPKEKIGIVGFSGSGKSTFTSLLLRLYDVQVGSIKIDQQDIKEVTLKSLRQNISIIPQNPILFNRSFKENIRYGKVNTSDDEIIEAAKKACIHDYITESYNGYDSLIGENGIKLSGGQSQRIAIARAILKNAPILILDEATSGLDPITEALIEKNIKKFMRDKTTIIIAHKMNTLLDMDRILVFDQGKIVSDGSHAELLIKCELYAKMWKTQIKKFN